MPDVLAQAVVQIVADVAGDMAKDLVDQFNEIDVNAEETAKILGKIQTAADTAAEVAAKGFNALGDASIRAADYVGSISGNITNVTDGLATFGIIGEGTADQVATGLGIVQGALEGAAAVTDLAAESVKLYASGLSALPAVQRAVEFAQKAMNLVLSANPIGLVVTAIALLAAGLVIAYKKSETFRNIVNAAFNGVKAAASVAFGFISKVATTAFNVILTAGRALKSFLGTIWSGVASAAKTAFNGLLTVLRPIAAVINKVIAGANKVSGAFGGPTIPPIPKFANGVRNFRGGFAEVGERGPEIVYLPPGSDVYSNSESQRMRGTGITQNNTYIFQGPESFAGARRDADWSAKHGTRFGNATRAVMPA